METGIKLHNLRKLRELRQSIYGRSGWSQSAVAEKLGVSLKTYGLWERGEVPPDTVNLVHIAHLFGITTDFLLGETDLNEEIKRTGLTAESVQVLQHLNSTNNLAVRFINRVLEAYLYRIGEDAFGDKRDFGTVFETMEQYVCLDKAAEDFVTVKVGDGATINTEKQFRDTALIFEMKKTLDGLRKIENERGLENNG